MKKTPVIIALSLLAFAACKHEDPLLHNAQKYIQALADYDFEEARRYATPETYEISLKYFEESVMPGLDSSFLEHNTPATIRIDSVAFLSDTQATVYYNKKTPLTNANATADMRLRDGQWLGHLLVSPISFHITNSDSDSLAQRPLQQQIDYSKRAPRKRTPAKE
ncbi:MAG: hypothetical protein IJ524_04170 [Bacteroidales bacterium]|nr:hypothetical protein [Bacteroidales bacterium]